MATLDYDTDAIVDPNFKRRVVFVSGKAHSGKTTYVQELVRNDPYIKTHMVFDIFYMNKQCAELDGIVFDKCMFNKSDQKNVFDFLLKLTSDKPLKIDDTPLNARLIVIVSELSLKEFIDQFTHIGPTEQYKLHEGFNEIVNEEDRLYIVIEQQKNTIARLENDNVQLRSKISELVEFCKNIKEMFQRIF